MELVTQARSALCHAARLWAEPAIAAQQRLQGALRVSLGSRRKSSPSSSASHSCSTDMDSPMGEINSLPALRHQPDGMQAMPVRDQHRCSVAMGRCDWPRRL